MTEKLTTIILPTSWLPPVEYFALLTTPATILTEVYESYPKQTCRNRCYIATANKVMPLSVPVTKTDGNNTRTGRVAVSYVEPWQRGHWRTFEAAYRNAAWFIHYEEPLKKVFFSRFRSLTEMNDAFITLLARLLKVEVSATPTTSWQENYPGAVDLRRAFKGTGSPAGEDSGLFPVYFQCFAERYGFQPNLSVVDLLFNCGPDSGEYLKTLGSKLLALLVEKGR